MGIGFGKYKAAFISLWRDLRKLDFLIAPLTIGLFPVLSLYARNTQDVLPRFVVQPVLIVVTLTLLAAFISRLFIKDRTKIGVLISLGWLFFFMYVPVIDYASNYIEQINDFDTLLLPLWFSVFLLGIGYIWRSNKSYSPALKFLTVMGVVVTSMQIITITLQSIQPRAADVFNYLVNNEPQTFNHSDQDNLPDIYYILLDGYPRSDTLDEYFGFDNSEFDTFLNDRGFFVANDSHTNYSQTALAVPAILNMSYIKDLPEQGGIPLEETMELYKNNKTLQFLDSAGYKWVNSNNFYRAGVNQVADINLNCITSNEFLKELIATTMLKPLDIVANQQRQQLREDGFCVMDNFSFNVSGPQFTFSHLIAPHPPYVYGANGEDVIEVNLSLNSGTRWLAKEPFIEQLKYVNKRATEKIEEILRSNENSIIIIQSDHGSLSSATESDTLTDARTVVFKERHRNYLAIHLPDYCDQSLPYHSMSGVNTFRVVLNSCFGTDYDLLEDKVYYNASGPRGYYGFRDITSEVTN